MTKEESFKIARCLWCIANSVSDKVFQEIKPWMDDIEEIAKKYADADEDDNNGNKQA